MPISRSLLSALSESDVLKQLNDNDQQSEMKSFIAKNGLKLDRVRKLGDYCTTLIYERDPTVTIVESSEPIAEKKTKKSKTSKKKTVS